MARVKVTSSDINAKLAKGECANYRNNSCQGSTPCLVLIGESCQYFATYVKPLLDYTEYLDKYGREAKISVALNPKAKVVRKRRVIAEPTPAEKSAKPVPEPVAAIDTPRPISADVVPPRKPAPARALTETKLVPVKTPVQKEKAVKETLPREQAAKPAVTIVSPLRNTQPPAQPELTLTVVPPAPTRPEEKRDITIPDSIEPILPVTPSVPAQAVTVVPHTEPPEQPQLFGDLFASPSPKKRAK